MHEYAIEYLQRAADERLTAELEQRRVLLERQADEPTPSRRAFSAWFRIGTRDSRRTTAVHRHAH